MPMLTPTGLHATVAALLVDPDRGAGLESEPRERVTLDWTGIVGEAHGGLTRAACSRVAAQYPRGAEIRNVRQLTAVSVEELEAIRVAMDAPCRLPAEVIERHLPGIGARFPKAALGRRGTTLWVERPGTLATGDALALHVPPPVRWRRPAAG